jgi:hypothetical protein
MQWEVRCQGYGVRVMQLQYGGRCITLGLPEAYAQAADWDLIVMWANALLAEYLAEYAVEALAGGER